jgi:hypothetical protein
MVYIMIAVYEKSKVKGPFPPLKKEDEGDLISLTISL